MWKRLIRRRWLAVHTFASWSLRHRLLWAVCDTSLAQTLRDSTAKLRQKHAGKNVDFEVIVKDGKTILRPVVK